MIGQQSAPRMLVRLVALDPSGSELGSIDGEELTVSTTGDRELVVANGTVGVYGPVTFGWEDLVPGYRRGQTVRLELQVTAEDA